METRTEQAAAEHRRVYLREWKRRNKDKVREYDERDRAKNPERYKERRLGACKKHHATHRAARNAASRAYFQTEAGRAARSRGELKRKTDPEKAARRAAWVKKRQARADYKLVNAFRSYIWRALKQRGGDLAGAFSLAGYTPEQFIEHIKRCLLPGMTLDNYGRGGWHVDHIIPLAMFDLTDPEQFKAAWALTNLRPLWAKDNLAKNAKRLHLL
jgi:hypothetical protein